MSAQHAYVPAAFGDGDAVFVQRDGSSIRGRVNQIRRDASGDSWVYNVQLEGGECLDVSEPQLSAAPPLEECWQGEVAPTIAAWSFQTPAAKPKARPKAKAKATEITGNHNASVFVRVRPLLQAELEAGREPLPGLQLEAKAAADGDGGVIALDGRTPIGGFSGIMGTDDGNEVVFDRTFRHCVPTVLRGGTAALFCYGYTGAGKTHTVFGIEQDFGMCRRAAESLLAQVASYNSGLAESEAPLQLHMTVVEVYNDVVFDLLGDRKQCALRVNSKGQLAVRGSTHKQMLDAAEAAEKGAEFTVTTEGLTSMQVTSAGDLDAIHERSKAHRAVGSSTEHDQSSRSHAVFHVEVVNERVLAAKAAIEEAEAIKPALQQKYAKTPKMDLRKRIQELEDSITKANKELDELCAEGSPLGGRLLLVDLAGADSDGRDLSEGHTAQQRKESIAINKSLLALKECLRGLHAEARGGVQRKLPFRDSSITRVLEEALVPKRGRDSDTVMLVNVAPPTHLEKKTVNSLRYGQLYAVGSSR